jgi:hypothetical protein
MPSGGTIESVAFASDGVDSGRGDAGFSSLAARSRQRAGVASSIRA